MNDWKQYVEEMMEAPVSKVVISHPNPKVKHIRNQYSEKEGLLSD